MLKNRNALTEDYVLQCESLFLNNIFAVDHLNFNTMLLYSSFGNEMPTSKLIDYLLKKGTRVFLPKCNTDTLTFEIIEIFPDRTMYTVNKYGISEPVPINSDKPCVVDCAIVPGVAFDKNCNRIGFGSGYYDKFLSENSLTYKIGICFEFQVVDNAYSDEHDIPMDMVVTEKNIYFRKNQ